MDAQNRLVNQHMPRELVASKFKKFEKLEPTLYRIRSSFIPQQPTELSTLELTNEFATIFNGEVTHQFLQYDNKNNNNRILIFACPESIKALAQSNIWHIDGTFKTSPINFMQVYTIHAFLYDQFFPSAYIILQHKSEITFLEVCENLKKTAVSLQVIN